MYSGIRRAAGAAGEQRRLAGHRDSQSGAAGVRWQHSQQLSGVAPRPRQVLKKKKTRIIMSLPLALVTAAAALATLLVVLPGHGVHGFAVVHAPKNTTAARCAHNPCKHGTCTSVRPEHAHASHRRRRRHWSPPPLVVESLTAAVFGRQVFALAAVGSKAGPTALRSSACASLGTKDHSVLP